MLRGADWLFVGAAAAFCWNLPRNVMAQSQGFMIWPPELAHGLSPNATRYVSDSAERTRVEDQ